MNKVYTQFFPKGPPARVCFGVDLPKGVLLELDALATTKNNPKL